MRRISRLPRRYTPAQLRAIFARYDRGLKRRAEYTRLSDEMSSYDADVGPFPKVSSHIRDLYKYPKYRILNHARSMELRKELADDLRRRRRNVYASRSVIRALKHMRQAKLMELQSILPGLPSRAEQNELNKLARAMQLDHLRQLIKERGSRKKLSLYLNRKSYGEDLPATPPDLLRKHAKPYFQRREAELLRELSKARNKSDRGQLKWELDSLTNNYANLMSRHVSDSL